LENILNLKSKYNLFLVTMGTHETQSQKIKALGIANHFQKIYILNGFVGERKESAFRDIIGHSGHSADQMLSIGNRLSSEIRDGKKIGADTCYFAYGEHLGEEPQLPEDRPDFTISHHKELITTCGL
jgi:putative hydrolase of the HAD superfamily